MVDHCGMSVTGGGGGGGGYMCVACIVRLLP